MTRGPATRGLDRRVPAALRVPVALLLLGCGGIPSAPEGALQLTDVAPADLPTTTDGLLADAARAAQDPSGPDFERSLAAAQRVLWTDSGAPAHDQATAIALRTFHLMAVAGDPDAVARRCQPLASRAQHDGGGAATQLYAAICLGHYAKATDSRDLVPVLVRLAKAAREKEAGIDHAGPDRLLGALYLRAPAWPTSVGDLDAALEHLTAAVQRAGDWPENQLLLAEALIADDRADDASVILTAVEASLGEPAYAAWHGAWRAHLDALRE